MGRYDIDRDGKVSQEDLEEVQTIVELELREEKARTQKRMAWTAMGTMFVFTLALFSPMLSDTRVKALGDLLGLFYIAQAGIVGAYMGVTAWMQNSRSSSASDYYSRSGYQSRSSRVDQEDDGPVDPPALGANSQKPTSSRSPGGRT